MHIAICDDDAQELNRIADLISSYAKEQHVSIRMKTFINAEDMLRAAQTEGFTHYFLDVMMPCMDGITAAQEIRTFDTEARIVFLTSFVEYAYQSYSVKAYDYLLKPAEQDRVFELLRQFQAQENCGEACIFIQNGRSFFRIPFAQLACLEVNRKKLYFQMEDGRVLQIAGTLSEFEHELLARREFIKIHRSYIVNLNQISELSPEGCILISGKNLPISRLLYDRVRKKYMTHLFGDEGGGADGCHV